jgi:hypothetical protein
VNHPAPTTSMPMLAIKVAAMLALTALLPALSWAQSAEELAKKLSNPVASLISVPLQFNHDENIGPADGRRSFVNVQPVVPISISQDWNLISRTIVPLIDQKDIAGPSGSQSGAGDIVQSLFFSPKAPTAGGLIWGAGPVLLLPTATDELLGSEKWGLGPTGVVLTQRGPWTYGALGNHIWSVAGKSSRADISATFVQPFLSYTTKSATSFGLNTESTYDWKSNRWTVPINVTVGQVLKLGSQLIQVGGGARYWAKSAPNGPEGWGYRISLTFLFPK